MRIAALGRKTTDPRKLNARRIMQGGGTDPMGLRVAGRRRFDSSIINLNRVRTTSRGVAAEISRVAAAGAGKNPTVKRALGTRLDDKLKLNQMRSTHSSFRGGDPLLMRSQQRTAVLQLNGRIRGLRAGLGNIKSREGEERVRARIKELEAERTRLIDAQRTQPRK